MEDFSELPTEAAPRLRDRFKAFFRGERPIPPNAAPEVELRPHLGHDFSKIKIHAGAPPVNGPEESFHPRLIKLDDLYRRRSEPTTSLPAPSAMQFRLRLTSAPAPEMDNSSEIQHP